MQIDMKKFYVIGKYAFLIIAVMGLTGFINQMITGEPTPTAWGILGTVANIIFNFGLMGFFAWLLSTQTKGVPTKQEIDNMLLEVMKDGEKLKQKNIH